VTIIKELECNNIRQPVRDWSLQKKNEWNTTEHLKIDNQQKTSFETGFFTKLINVITIQLHNNLLTTIDFNEFASNSKLEQLNLGFNQITEIQQIKQSTEISITNLELHNNDLTDITELCKLQKLKELNLSRNRRIDFSKMKFNCWSGLTHLFLTDTNLKKLGQNYHMLDGCNRLEYLNLMDNDLELLCFGLFPVLPQLQQLNIRNNSLTSLDVAGLKYKFRGLKNITKTANKWSCVYHDNLTILLERSNIKTVKDSYYDTNQECIQTNEMSFEMINKNIQKCKDIEKEKPFWFFFSFWFLIIFDCILLISLLVLLGFCKL
jgi:Leucine-rich repeat (LRR) protein